MKPFFRKSICALLLAMAPGWGMPARAFAQEATSDRQQQLEENRVDAVPVRLDADGRLRGVVRSKDGQLAANASVVLGVKGKPVQRATSNAQGQFEFGPLKPGEYQVATRDACAMLAVYTRDGSPENALKEVEVSQPAMIARGQSPSSILLNPWFIGLVVAAAIAIPVAIALDDDDDDAS